MDGNREAEALARFRDVRCEACSRQTSDSVTPAVCSLEKSLYQEPYVN